MATPPGNLANWPTRAWVFLVFRDFNSSKGLHRFLSPSILVDNRKRVARGLRLEKTLLLGDPRNGAFRGAFLCINEISAYTMAKHSTPFQGSTNSLVVPRTVGQSRLMQKSRPKVCKCRLLRRPAAILQPVKELMWLCQDNCQVRLQVEQARARNRVQNFYFREWQLPQANWQIGWLELGFSRCSRVFNSSKGLHRFLSLSIPVVNRKRVARDLRLKNTLLLGWSAFPVCLPLYQRDQPLHNS